MSRHFLYFLLQKRELHHGYGLLRKMCIRDRGFTVYNLFNEKYENNGWASSDYTDTVENRGNYAGYAAQAGTNVMGHRCV